MSHAAELNIHIIRLIGADNQIVPNNWNNHKKMFHYFFYYYKYLFGSPPEVKISVSIITAQRLRRKLLIHIYRNLITIFSLQPHSVCYLQQKQSLMKYIQEKKTFT